MTAMKPCPKCHSTEHMRIEMTDGHSSASGSVKAWRAECDIFAQTDYVPTGPFANERGPGDVQSVCEAIKRWNGHCDDWEEIFNHE